MVAGGQIHIPAALTVGKRTVPIVQEAHPRAALDKCEISRPTGIGSSYRPPRSESLYRLSYPGPCNMRKGKYFAFILVIELLFAPEYTTVLFTLTRHKLHN